MRCTRCDGLAVPQAVGLTPDGRVIFGWCLACLAETGCELVDDPPSGPPAIHLSAMAGPPARKPISSRNPRARGPGRRQRIMAVVASLMIGWGLILLAAALFTGSRQAADSSPMGNGTAPLLGVGGTATALLGLGLMVLARRRTGFPGSFLPGLLSLPGFLIALRTLAPA